MMLARNKFAFLVVLLPQVVFAFTLNSTSDSSFKGWLNPELTFNVNAANCPSSIDVPALITEAVAVWNNVATSRIKVTFNGTSTSTTYANPTTVYCESNFQSVTGADQNYVPAAASITTSGHNAAGGLLLLNVSGGTANISAFDHTKLLIIIAHEVGHILGLGHSPSPSALMYYDASSKTNLTLSQDDVDGVSYLYPRDELGADKMMGCGLVASPKPPTRAGLALLMGIFFLPLLTLSYLRKRV